MSLQLLCYVTLGDAIVVSGQLIGRLSLAITL